jgi:hypothetical protein
LAWADRNGLSGRRQYSRINARLIEAAECLVELHEATGNAAEAERWRKELAQRKAADNAGIK